MPSIATPRGRVHWRENRFAEHLSENSAARNAIKRLVGGGCSHTRLIWILRAFTHPDRKRNSARVIRTLVPSKQQTERVAKMLAEASDEIWGFASYPSGLVVLGAKQAEDAIRFSAEMELMARSLRQWAHTNAKALQRFSFRATWKHVPLALAAHVLRDHAGRVPYGDLAFAAEAVAAGYGAEPEVSPEALRREYERFSRSHAGRAFHLSGMVEALLSLIPS